MSTERGTFADYFGCRRIILSPKLYFTSQIVNSFYTHRLNRKGYYRSGTTRRRPGSRLWLSGSCSTHALRKGCERRSLHPHSDPVVPPWSPTISAAAHTRFFGSCIGVNLATVSLYLSLFRLGKMSVAKAVMNKATPSPAVNLAK